jgi:predicted nucleic acid-binding Zn ribbon protein
MERKDLKFIHCAQCGKEIIKFHNRTRFCSAICRTNWGRAEKKRLKAGDMRDLFGWIKAAE